MKLQANILKIDMTRAFKNKRIDFKSMSEADRLNYALSFLGIKKRVELSRLKYSPKMQYTLDDKISKRHENYFLNLQRDMCKIGYHTPNEKFKYFGVEIECLIPYSSLNIDKDDHSSSEYSECLDCEGTGRMTFTHRDSGHEMEGECPTCEGTGEVYNEDSDDSDLFSACKSALSRRIKALNIRGCDIKDDGSLETNNDELWPVELTILVRQDDLTALEKLCGLLNDLEAEVNSSCGLHVHIDARHMSKSQVSRAGMKLGHALPFLGQMVPKSRRENTRYCKMKVSGFSDDRYCAVNLTAFEKYKTIEVRLHSSTTSYKKISNWIKTLSLILDAKKSKLESMTTLKEFFAVIGASDELQNYIISRVAKFNGTADETTCEAQAVSEQDNSTLDMGVA